MYIVHKYSGEDDTPEHTLEKCELFKRKRKELESRRLRPLKCTEMVKEMIEDEKDWTVVSTFIKDILSEKEEIERQRSANLPV